MVSGFESRVMEEMGKQETAGKLAWLLTDG